MVSTKIFISTINLNIDNNKIFLQHQISLQVHLNKLLCRGKVHLFQ